MDLSGAASSVYQTPNYKPETKKELKMYQQ